MMRMRWVVNRLGAGLFVGVALAGCTVMAATPARAADGYDLWMQPPRLEAEEKHRLQAFNPVVRVATDNAPASDVLRVAADELRGGLVALTGSPAANGQSTKRTVSLDCPAAQSGDGSFTVQGTPSGITITGAGDLSCLYGAYALLRALALGADPQTVALAETPAMPSRMLNHWDDPDGHVERGYAGRSIFDWWRLPDRLDRRMIDYARANASLGINGVVVNNVNASPLFLTPRYLPKLKRLADAWRPYGIRLYISARFSAPRDIGGLAKSDPLDPAVADWWKAKADEIYAAIPDFGGFLVKANSEGQPGPQDYGRTHADGANMLAAALGDRGTVIWRAFVYQPENKADRTTQAYTEFAPLDGKFAQNVIVQVKNGPLDFQPREPFHPLFGAMPKTRLMLEVQPTREYLGQGSGIVYLAPMWEEVLRADTGRGGTVADVIRPAGMAGVANIGSARNWTGAHFDQANWYAFGRLAWNPRLTSEMIAREWAGLTFTRNRTFADRIVPVMLASRDAVVNYTGPLGLAHQMATGHHYGPGPWICDLPRPDWNPCTYSAANKRGIGFDRTKKGSNALGQYAAGVAASWSDPARIDPRYLLWFHHVAWDHKLNGGRSLWVHLLTAYDRGVAQVDEASTTWAQLAPFVDAERHEDVNGELAAQRREARWWRDASIAYWQSVNGLSLPVGMRPPEHTLEEYRQETFPEAPGQ